MSWLKFFKDVFLCDKDYGKFCRSIEANDIETVKNLLEKTRNVDFTSLKKFPKNINCFTPLFWAVNNSSYEIAEILLIGGANPNISVLLKADHWSKPLSKGTRKKVSRTALFYVEKPEVVNLLVRYGAEINYQDAKGQTALHYMIKKKKRLDCVEALLKHGINTDLCCHYRGQSALQLAVACRNIKALILILKYGKGDALLETIKSTNVISDHPFGKDADSEDVHKLVFTLLGQGASKMFLYSHCNLSVHGDSLSIFRPNYKLYRTSNSLIECKTWPLPRKLALMKQKFEKPGTIVKCRDLTECEKELKTLKTIVIYPGVTMFDLLFMKIKQMMNYCQNENLVKLFKECGEDFETRFKHYGFLLNTKLKRAKRRRESVALAVEKLEDALAKRLPELCSQKIFKYLSDGQLKIFNGLTISKPMEVIYNFIQI